MSYVELRNQERIEEIRKIRQLLLPRSGDMENIKKISGKSYRAVIDTLNEDHPLFSQAVIEAAWKYLKENGRLKNEVFK